MTILYLFILKLMLFNIDNSVLIAMSAPILKIVNSLKAKISVFNSDEIILFQKLLYLVDLIKGMKVKNLIF